jgi:hypothetical protein
VNCDADEFPEDDCSVEGDGISANESLDSAPLLEKGFALECDGELSGLKKVISGMESKESAFGLSDELKRF